jgi:hypothetical protein
LLRPCISRVSLLVKKRCMCNFLSNVHRQGTCLIRGECIPLILLASNLSGPSISWNVRKYIFKLMMPISNTELLQPNSSNYKVHNYLHIPTLHPHCMKKLLYNKHNCTTNYNPEWNAYLPTKSVIFRQNLKEFVLVIWMLYRPD